MESKEENMDIKICDVCEERKVNTATDLGKTFVYDSEGDIVCKPCAYEIWTRKCIKCKGVFQSPVGGGLVPCPQCEDEDKERYGIKATKKDIDKLFDG